MRNKRLMPFEVIKRAVAEEPETIDVVLRCYTGYIKYLSMHEGYIDDDTQDRLKVKLVKAVLKFQFDRQEIAKAGKAVKGKLRTTRP